MKSTLIPKINPIAELTFPTLLQCKSGECGGCPNNTGKLLWVPRKNSADTSWSETFNFQYNFFDKSAESNSEIRHNVCTGFNTLTSSNFTYSAPPTRAWAVANNAIQNFTLSPSLMRGTSFRTYTFPFQGEGGWLFFRQPNPTANNVHDALCFEYNHEKRLIIFRSF